MWCDMTMDKRSSESSPRDPQNDGNETRIVRSTRKAGDPLSVEALAELEALKGHSDAEIDFFDIPPSSPGFWKQALARRTQRLQDQMKEAS